MQIPNVRIDILGTNGAGCSRLAPVYVGPLLKALWGPRLDPKGYEVGDIPVGAPDRYREVGSIAEEERIWQAEFPLHFDKIYPSGLRAEIEQVLRADAKARKAAADKVAAPIEAHPSFIAAGCSGVQAASLQTAGYASLHEIPDDFMKIAEVPGITPDFALALIDAKDEILATEEAAAKIAKAEKAAKKNAPANAAAVAAALVGGGVHALADHTQG